MAAPIAVELVASPASPPDGDLVRALVESCSAAAGPAGCVLEVARLADGDDTLVSSPPPAPALPPTTSPAPRARVVVAFSAADGRVRVVVLAPVPEGGALSRDVVFRDEDPRLERFRAAGLIVAGLVFALEGSAAEASPGSPGIPALAVATPAGPRHEAIVRLGGLAGDNDARPWAGAELGADFLVVAPVFVALSASYAQTWARDASGIADQRTSLGLGAGLATPLLPERLELRLRIELELQQLRASIHQPGTGREDAGSRVLGGLEAGADLVLPMDSTVRAFAGARLAWSGDDTTVRVAGRPAETIHAWMLSFALGLNVRLP